MLHSSSLQSSSDQSLASDSFSLNVSSGCQIETENVSNTQLFGRETEVAIITGPTKIYRETKYEEIRLRVMIGKDFSRNDTNKQIEHYFCLTIDQYQFISKGCIIIMIIQLMAKHRTNIFIGIWKLNFSINSSRPKKCLVQNVNSICSHQYLWRPVVK